MRKWSSIFIDDSIRLALIIAAGSWICFSCINDAMIHQIDETKSYWNFFGPSSGLFIINRFFISLTASFDASFYVNGAFHLASALILYGLLRFSASPNKALMGALAFIALEFPLSMSKTLFYSTPIITFYLLSFLCFYFFKKKDYLIGQFLTGVFLAMMVLMHPSSYALAVGFAALLLSELKTFPKYRGVAVALFTSLGVILTLVLWDHFFVKPLGGGFSYLIHAFSHQNHTASELWAVDRGWNGLINVGHRHLIRAWSDGYSAIRHLTVIGILGIGVVRVMRGQEEIPKKLLLSILFASALFFLMALLGFHTIYERHMVWMSLLLPIAIIFLPIHFASRKWQSLLAISLCALFFSTQSLNAVEITRSLPSGAAIERYLLENNILRNQVTTSYEFLNRRDSILQKNGYRRIPVIPHKAKMVTGRPMKMIVWPIVFKAHQEGNITHFLSSDLRLDYLLGQEADLVIQNTMPVMTWPHPESNAHISSLPIQRTIALYRISDLKATYLKLYTKQ